MNKIAIVTLLAFSIFSGCANPASNPMKDTDSTYAYKGYVENQSAQEMKHYGVDLRMKIINDSITSNVTVYSDEFLTIYSQNGVYTGILLHSNHDTLAYLSGYLTTPGGRWYLNAYVIRSFDTLSGSEFHGASAKLIRQK